MAKQKNIVGNLRNVHYARIGDEVHVHIGKTTYSRDLTLNIPRTHPADLVGRQSDLKTLRSALDKDKRVVVVNGIGGIGKTTLARAYVSTYYQEYAHVAWITQDADDIAKDFANTPGLVQNLDISLKLNGPQAIFGEIIRKLKSITAGPNLLVIDNGEPSLKKYLDLLPGQPHWHLLVTSRETITGFYHQPLGFLDIEEATTLFKKHYPYQAISKMGIHQLVKAVDYHTLTIEIMAKMAARQRYDLSALRQALKKDLRANVEIAHSNLSKPIEKIGSYLQTTFTLSHLNNSERWLLKQFACLPPEPQTYKRLRSLLIDEKGPHAAIFAETLMKLSEKGWLTHYASTDTYDMHRIIAEVVQKDDPVKIDDVDTLLRVITDKLQVEFTTDNALDKFEWVPYGKALLNIFSRNSSPEIACLQNRLGFVLLPLNELTYAKKILEKAVRSDTKNFGENHPTTMMHVNNLALVYLYLRDFKTARKMFQRTVRNDERNLGPLHNHTAIRYLNLSLALCEMRKFQAAEKMSRHVLEIRRTTVGLAHPGTGGAYGLLARIMKEQGRDKEAMSFVKKAIQCYEKYYGKDHSATMGLYHRLGTYYYDAWRLTDAQRLLEKVVKAYEQIYGTTHHSTAIVYNDLALILSGRNKHLEAKELFERSLQIKQSNHPNELENIAISNRNLALTLNDLEDFKSAIALLERAVAMFTKVCGPSHKLTRLAKEDLIFTHLFAEITEA